MVNEKEFKMNQKHFSELPIKHIQIRNETNEEDANNDYKVIDDFLPKDIFDELQSFMIPTAENFKSGMEQMHWAFTPGVSEISFENWRMFYFTHLVYNNAIMSPFYNNEFMVKILTLLGVKALKRIKTNMYPYSEKLIEHGMHIDYPWPHKGALFSINTCDGYTKLEDGTKIDSVANRMLLFDSSKLHCSTNCTNQSARVNINFNYF